MIIYIYICVHISHDVSQLSDKLYNKEKERSSSIHINISSFSEC